MLCPQGSQTPLLLPPALGLGSGKWGVLLLARAVSPRRVVLRLAQLSGCRRLVWGAKGAAPPVYDRRWPISRVCGGSPPR